MTIIHKTQYVMKIRMISLLILWFSFPVFLYAQVKKDKRKKPNFLFLIVDDLRPELGCYGKNQIISPNIDKLASDGVLFTQAYCQVPVCGASRASILTGVRPTRSRFTKYYSVADDDAPGLTGLPKFFKENGYYTVSNGKVYHHYEKDGAGSWSEPPWHPNGWVEAPWYAKGNWANYLTEENAFLLKNEKGMGKAFELIDVEDNAYFDGVIAQKTIGDLRRLKKSDKPFFMITGFRKPHLPFNAPKKYWELYNENDIDLAQNPFRPQNSPDASLNNLWEISNYVGIPQTGQIPDSLAKTLIHGYYACISYVDAQIGKVIHELEILGLRENTVVVLIGDHGWHLGEHGLWSKFTNFEESLKSPLIISAPTYKKGIVSNALVEYIDIYPSLCELCGFDIPNHLDGRSFVPLLTNPELKWKDYVFSRYGDGESVKNSQYRYTEWKDENGRIYARMLYDHNSDPFENYNIAENPEYVQIVKMLSEKIHDLQNSKAKRL